MIILKVLRKIIEIDEELCDGCGQCVPACEEGAIQIIDGKARLVAEKYCDGLGACLGDCPTGALKIVEREAEDFDENAVEVYLKKMKAADEVGKDGHVQNAQPAQPASPVEKMACGCPSSMIRSLSPAAQNGVSGDSCHSKPAVSHLSHWPVQLNLIPPHAPFLKDAHLLITADCVAVALPDYHSRFLPGRVVMLGCPKFDDQEAYIEKFTNIFQQNRPKSVTVLIMEVPCCSQMLSILKDAMKRADSDFPLDVKIVGLKGGVQDRE